MRHLVTCSCASTGCNRPTLKSSIRSHEGNKTIKKDAERKHITSAEASNVHGKRSVPKLHRFDLIPGAATLCVPNGTVFTFRQTMTECNAACLSRARCLGLGKSRRRWSTANWRGRHRSRSHDLKSRLVPAVSTSNRLPMCAA